LLVSYHCCSFAKYILKGLFCITVRRNESNAMKNTNSYVRVDILLIYGNTSMTASFHWEEKFWTVKLVQPCLSVLKWLYQAKTMNGYVYVCICVSQGKHVRFYSKQINISSTNNSHNIRSMWGTLKYQMYKSLLVLIMYMCVYVYRFWN
jgi:hypothetical protein